MKIIPHYSGITSSLVEVETNISVVVSYAFISVYMD